MENQKLASTGNRQLKPHLKSIVIEGEGVLLLKENGCFVLYDEIHERLIPLLENAVSIDTIIQKLSDQYDKIKIYSALIELEAKGYLCETTRNLTVENAAFWSEIGVDPERAIRYTKERKVKLIEFGEVDIEPIIQILNEAGICLTDCEDDAFLSLVVCDNYIKEEIVALNKRFRANKKRWLIVRPRGRELWLGPYFNEDKAKSGCLECLVSRLKRQRGVHQFVAAKTNTPLSEFKPLAKSKISNNIIINLTALEICRIIMDMPSNCSETLINFDSRDYSMTKHKLLIDPQCKVCGNRETPRFKPVVLKPCSAKFIGAGGHRHISPEETVEKYKHYVSPITGVIKQLAKVRTDCENVHVYVSGENNAQRLEKLSDLRMNLRSQSGGKGTTQAQAQAGALCEALERFSGSRQGNEIIEKNSYKQMVAKYGDRAIHPNDVMRFSANQYKERCAINSNGSRFNNVPHYLEDDCEIEWTPIWSMTRLTTCYLPTQLIYMGEAPQESPEKKADQNKRYSIGCSNGNASGNTIEEAVLQGLLELIERDSTAIWWYNRLNKRAINLDSCKREWIDKIIKDYNSLGRDIWALDITSDLGIPSVAALSKDKEGGHEKILIGLGCHLDPSIAVQRAISEMNQMLVFSGTLNLDDHELNSKAHDDETTAWLLTATADTHPYLMPDPNKELINIDEIKNQSSDDLLKDINFIRSIIEKKGMELLVLDQTNAIVNIAAVKVVVPGLRHFWSRLGHGRLYTVPVEMGWKSKELDETEMNPIPIFF